MATGQVDVIIADLAQFTRLEVVALALNVDANLKEMPPLGTPRDTGWAAANWVPSIGEPSRVDASTKDPTPADIAARQAVADQGRNDVLGWKPDDGMLFSTNNVPYIEPLNDGHSKQSPSGFVLTAIEKAIKETYSAAASRGARNRRAATARAKKAKPRR